MKSTIKTSRAAGQLEKMFRELNKHYYNGELPEPIITLKKTLSAYGHITTVKTWTVSTEQGTEQRYEINISTATLDRPIENTTATPIARDGTPLQSGSRYPRYIQPERSLSQQAL